MSASAQRIKEAKEFIRKLREERGADNSQEKDHSIRFIVKGFDKSLKVLSEDLYTTPTHFLLELVQNADDNDYDSKNKPLLRFKLDGQYLQVGCNEKGFTQGNINAICDIGESTKSSTMKAKGYIGEKGLGFKSVFKVAETVWISSGPYQFKFEKNARLGMVTPIWEEMPEQFKGSGTQFLLKMASRDNINLVHRELEEFDSSILIFLRKLQKIEVSLADKRVTLSKSVAQKFYGEALNLEVINHDTDPPRKYSHKYLLERFRIDHMPDEEKRPNISESEVILGFPFSNSREEPVIENQRVHNFLPVGRKYGFYFLIQADFLLTANRESIHDVSAWNTCLVSGVASAFTQAVHRFNRSKEFRYKWPLYLPLPEAGAGSLLKNLREQILNILSSTDCLEAQNGTFTRPSQLYTVPSKFYDSSGNFLLAKERTGSKFLSRSYAPDTVWRFKIREYHAADFVRDLHEFWKKKSTEFMAMPESWHSAVSTALLSCLGELEKIKLIPLIPLRGGMWVSATGSIYFEDVAVGEIKIPNGLEVSIIDSAASEDPERRRLFQSLGAKRLDRYQVCQLVVDQHNSMRLRASVSWILQDFIDHAYYLFSASTIMHSLSLESFILVDHRRNTGLAKNMYLDAPSSSFRISEYFGEDNPEVRRLHPAYFKIEGLNLPAWVSWLSNSLKVADELRFLSNPWTLSSEFNWLINNRPDQCLKLMRDSYQVDAHFLRTHGAKFKERLRVKCKNGSSELISSVFLARSSIMKIKSSSTMLTFADLPDPEDDRWMKFRLIGLGVDLDLKFYLEYLKSMHKKKCSVREVKEIYEEVEKRWHEDRELVKKVFRENNVVFIGKHLQQSKEWVEMSKCRWKAPAGLSKIFALAERYPSCKTLFTSHLSLQDATTDDIITELLTLDNKIEETDLIQSLLVELSMSLKGKRLTNTQFSAIFDRKVFPTYKESKQLSTGKEHWFIVDRSILERCFKGIILLLDVEPGDIRLLQPLLKELGVADWTLSNRVTETLSFKGDVAVNAVLTDNLSSKAKFFASLVSEGIRTEMLSKFEKIQVFSTTKIVVERKCLIKTKAFEETVPGRDDEGDVILLEKDGQLQIYFSVRDVRSGDLPWPELAERICEFCGIDAAAHGKLVLEILTTTNVHRIRNKMEKSDVHVDAIFRKPKPFVSSMLAAQEDEDEIEDVEMQDNFGDDATGSQAQVPATTSLNLSNNMAGTTDSTNQSNGADDSEANDVIVSDEKILQAATSAQFNSTARQPSTRSGQSARARTDSENATTGAQEPGVRSLRSRNVQYNAGSPGRPTRSTAQTQRPSESNGGDYSHARTSSSTTTPTAVAPTGSSGSPPANSSPSTGQHSSFSTHKNRRIGLPTPSNGNSNLPEQLPAPRTEREMERDERIGYLGELLMFGVFRQKFGEQVFTFESWTSTNRCKAGFSEFSGSEMDHSDFTFFDESGEFGRLFQLSMSTKGVTLHLEIKSTLASDADEPFHMSYNQQRLARYWSFLNQSEKQITDAFIVVRVYGLADVPQYRIYVDPWDLLIKDELEFKPQGSFLVFPSSTSDFKGASGSSNAFHEAMNVNATAGQAAAGVSSSQPIVLDEDEEEEEL